MTKQKKRRKPGRKPIPDGVELWTKVRGDLAARCEAFCAARSRSTAEVLRVALEEYLDRQAA